MRCMEVRHVTPQAPPRCRSPMRCREGRAMTSVPRRESARVHHVDEGATPALRERFCSALVHARTTVAPQNRLTHASLSRLPRRRSRSGERRQDRDRRAHQRGQQRQQPAAPSDRTRAIRPSTPALGSAAPASVIIHCSIRLPSPGALRVATQMPSGLETSPEDVCRGLPQGRATALDELRTESSSRGQSRTTRYVPAASRTTPITRAASIGCFSTPSRPK